MNPVNESDVDTDIDDAPAREIERSILSVDFWGGISVDLSRVKVSEDEALRSAEWLTQWVNQLPDRTA